MKIAPKKKTSPGLTTTLLFLVFIIFKELERSKWVRDSLHNKNSRPPKYHHIYDWSICVWPPSLYTGLERLQVLHPHTGLAHNYTYLNNHKDYKHHNNYNIYTHHNNCIDYTPHKNTDIIMSLTIITIIIVVDTFMIIIIIQHHNNNGYRHHNNYDT